MPSRSRVWLVATSGPRKWCSPSETFGQLTINGDAVKERVWLPPNRNDPVEVAKFRAAVMQNVICLHVRGAKNSLPHPEIEGRTFPLDAFAALDERSNDSEKWQGRLTGRYNLTTQDIVTIIEVLPGAMPSEREVRTFLDVAQNRINRPRNWPWPDTSAW